jgi:hypothetical protein
MMIGFEPDGSTLQKSGSLIEGLGPAFVKNGADHRTPLSPAHPRPVNRRPRMEDHSVGKARNHFSGPRNVHQHWVRGIYASYRLRIRGFDFLFDVFHGH